MPIFKTSRSFKVRPRSLYEHFGSHTGPDCFTRHQIERSVPVEALIKCKMQDNLEFLQWTKRFWDQYYPGGDYDALGRRKGSGAPPSSGPPAAAARTSGAGAARRGTTPTTTSAARPMRPAGGGAATSALSQENTQLKETVTGLERERDFYFSKLRDIELLIQQAIEVDPKVDADDDGLVKQIQAILYSTEVCLSGQSAQSLYTYRMLQEGFEIPAEAEEGPVQDDLETF